MSTQIVVKENVVAVQDEWTRERIETLKSTICKGATDGELAVFIEACRRTRLDPFARQIYAIKRWDAKEQREVMVPQASVDGFRVVAQRTGEYDGQEALWCDETGKWVDVWLSNKPPAAAKVIVYKKGSQRGTSAVALYQEYLQTKKDGKIAGLWKKMPANQLAKCAESLALRKAFPNDLSGIYTKEEMEQADNHTDIESPARLVNPSLGEHPVKDTQPDPLAAARKYIKPYGNASMGKGKPLGELPLDFLMQDVKYWEKRSKERGEEIKGKLKEYIDNVKLLTGAPPPNANDNIPF